MRFFHSESARMREVRKQGADGASHTTWQDAIEIAVYDVGATGDSPRGVTGIAHANRESLFNPAVGRSAVPLHPAMVKSRELVGETLGIPVFDERERQVPSYPWYGKQEVVG
jgi:hypothetical protein